MQQQRADEAAMVQTWSYRKTGIIDEWLFIIDIISWLLPLTTPPRAPASRQLRRCHPQSTPGPDFLAPPHLKPTAEANHEDRRGIASFASPNIHQPSSSPAATLCPLFSPLIILCLGHMPPWQMKPISLSLHLPPSKLSPIMGL